MSFRKHTRIGWMLVSALLLATTAGACVGFVPGAIGGGILVMLVSAGLLLLGACGGRALTGDDARVGPCLQPPLRFDAKADSRVGPCLSLPPRFDADPPVTPCLRIIPEPPVHPCLSILPEFDASPDAGGVDGGGAEAGSDVRVGPCLSIDARLGPCLSAPHAALAPAAREPAPSPAVHRSPEQDRELAIAKLRDRLPADLQSRLGGRAKS